MFHLLIASVIYTQTVTVTPDATINLECTEITGTKSSKSCISSYEPNERAESFGTLTPQFKPDCNRVVCTQDGSELKRIDGK